MPATTMHVQLLTMTPDAEALIYAACRQCTSADDAANTFKHEVFDVEENNSLRQEHRQQLIRRVIDSGHLSVLEHVQFSFAVSGVSRALSHQLVRHRIASYSQQSQRYVKANGFEFVTPNKIYINDEALELYEKLMRQIDDVYYDLVGAYGIPPEDARFVLPNACATKLVATMNCRALLHFFEERCCTSAQWEIRALAKAMLNICKDRLPVVFEEAGPKCVRQGYCNEGKKSCGRYPLRGE